MRWTHYDLELEEFISVPKCTSAIGRGVKIINNLFTFPISCGSWGYKKPSYLVVQAKHTARFSVCGVLTYADYILQLKYFVCFV